MALRFILFVIIACIFQTGQKIHAQDFPNALALIQYLKGVNESRVPIYFRAEMSIDYFTNNKGPEKGKQTFICGESQILEYDLPSGINAKVHIQDSQVLILKSERVFETKRIDIENFLLFGIHKQDPEKSIGILKQLGIDTEIIDEAIRLGRSMWVIGAYRRDANTPQIWIDKERLVIKKIHYINLPQQKLEQMEWSDYKKNGDFYVPLQCELRSDPELLFRLKRENPEFPKQLPDEIHKLLNF
ncbi:MAG: hypothetical protein RLN79_07970 [Cytophagales bacterium]